MLTLPATSTLKEPCERVFRAFSHGSSSSKESLSPPWTPIKEKSHPLSKSVNAHDIPKNYPLLWKVQPKGTYTPESEAGTSYAYTADLAAELPVSSKELHILAEGDLLGNGIISIFEDSENKHVGSDLLVDIRMYYDHPQLVKMTEISYVHSLQNENGLRLHTSPATKPEPTSRFISIHVHIPKSTGSDPLSLPAFRTHLPNFLHTIGELGSVAQFSSITLSSSDKAIVAKSLSAGRVRIRTTNGAIEGSFNSTSHTSLRTVNAPINVDLVLVNDGASTSNLELISSNAEITASMSLGSSAPEGKLPSYRILGKTAHKSVNLKCPVAPVNSSVQVEIQTTNAPATLRLPVSYEGKFDLHCTPFKPVVSQSENVSDPAGASRRRVVKTARERRGLLSGSVGWVSEEGEATPSNSDVSIKTSNAEAHLFL